MYLNDSVGMKITALDFDLETGTVSNQRTLVDFQTTSAEPDGLVIESVTLFLITVARTLIRTKYSDDGNLWVAVYATGSVMVFSPEGKKLKEVILPAKYPTCPTWGGKNYDILYISTARDRTQNPDPNDDGGHMYMFRPSGVQGQAKYEYGG